MLCENCGNTAATTHIKRVVNGVVTEKYLCSHCASKLGYSVFEQNSFAGILASMFGDKVTDEPVLKSKTCPCCNNTFADIVKSGKVGCPQCYSEFYNELLPYLKRIHGSTKHVGKIPGEAQQIITPVINNVSRLEELKNELHRLVECEEYESAAKIRDEIRQMESEGENNE